MENIKLVVCDVDGTLYGEERILTDRTRKAIEALGDKRIKFALASGRDVVNMRAYPAKWGFKKEFDGYIGMNGAMVYDYNSNVGTTEYVMSFEEVDKILKHIACFNLNCSIFADDGVIYSYFMDDDVRDSMKRNANAKVEFHCLEGDLSKISHLGVYKVCFRIAESRMPELEKYMIENPLEGFDGFKTQPVYYEIMLKGVSKAVGLKNYCKMNNIDLSEVVAFGDTTNDNEMLKCCYGVCLVNGSDDTKACAKEITKYSAENDGLAIWLEENIL